jgi:transposase
MARQYSVRAKLLRSAPPLGTLQAMRGGLTTDAAVRAAQATRADLLLDRYGAGPYQSGERPRDQGITRAGNKHVRQITVQLAWNWVRYQPDRALTRWYQRRFDGAGGRMRRTGMVALARKLLIAPWRYLETGTLPDGATLKA